MKCLDCDGTGKRIFTLVNRDADGRVWQQEKSWPCPTCGGTGQVTAQAAIEQMERERREALRG